MFYDVAEMPLPKRRPPQAGSPRALTITRMSVLLALKLWILGCNPDALLPSKNAGTRESAGRDRSTDEPHARASQPTPRLVIWITVDQMRGDYLTRYARHFGDGGFNRLLRAGTWFKNAHFGHAITETAPGHATLFSGVAPREHGIVGNSWLLQDGTGVTSVADDKSPLIGPGVTSGLSSEKGRSPVHLLSPTLADVLVRETGGKAHFIAISMKDRGAILPAGQSGLALWMGPSGFVTSTHYGSVPSWATEAHRVHPPESYLTEGWPLLLDEAEYGNESAASPHADKSLKVGFPHEFPAKLSPALVLKHTPFGDSAVLDLGETAIEGENLGADDVVDVLALSLSSTDMIGHMYGPESRELEDQLVRLDRELSDFFEFCDRKVGAKHFGVVLSSDHGGAESVEYFEKQGIVGVRLSEAAVEKAATLALQKKYGKQTYFLGVASPYVVLRRESIAADGKDLGEVRRVVAEGVSNVAGVHLAQSVGETLPDGTLGEKLAAAFHPGRSGDVYVVPERHSLFLQKESFAATHGSPWDYDTHVPIILAFGGQPAGRISERAVDVRSLVPTVAEWIGVPPPGDAKHPTLEP